MNQIERKTIAAIRKAILKAYGESKGTAIWLTIYTHLGADYKE